MSFLGTVGHLMQGSGLASIFDMIYADSTVPYILNGKAVSRATRAHLISYACLVGFQVAKQFGFDIIIEENGGYHFQEDLPEEVKGLLDLSEKLSKGEMSSEEIEENNTFINAEAKIFVFKEQRSESKTAKLWFQYMETVELLCHLINAERSGNWQQHLQAIRDMLPYFIESGHLLYAKSYLYLQSMMKLPETHPSVYKQFQDGLHIICRSDCFWAGPSSDLVIEQVLMRSVQTSCCLTSGRGFSDVQRAIWLLSTPVTSSNADVH